MRAVLIGTDLMYRQDGKLVPIEINTNIGYDEFNRKESDQETFDVSDLVEYALAHGITDVYLQGFHVGDYWPVGCPVRYHQIRRFGEVYTIEDTETNLIIRTEYNDEAYLDNFCRDKINFLKAIKSLDFGSEYILKTGGGLEGSITTIHDNGPYPNFLVKSRYPKYSRFVYPKVLRFETLEALQAYAETELEEDYFIMPFYYNPDKGIYWEEEPGHEDHKRIKFIRNLSVFALTDEGTIDSVPLGSYTKFTHILDESKLVWKEDGTPEDPDALREMLFHDRWVNHDLQDVVLDEDDVVLMEDGTWKRAQDIQAGDKVKSIYLPHADDVDIREHAEDYDVSLEEVETESEWTINEVKVVRDLESWVDIVNLTFTDGTDWYDTHRSAYPTIDPEDGSVKFLDIKDFMVGTKVILMPFNAQALENPEFVVKEVASISTRRKLQRGYTLSLDGSHLFLSRASEDEVAYISIEHNAACSVGRQCQYLASVADCDYYCTPSSCTMSGSCFLSGGSCIGSISCSKYN